MRKIILFMCILSNFYAHSQSPSLTLIFNEEFDSGMSSLWNRDDWRNNQVCTDGTRVDFSAYRTTGLQNIVFEDETGTGNISLIAKSQSITRTNIYDMCLETILPTHIYNYTAPSFFSSKDSFKYGYFEIRCKIPEVIGKDNYGIGANFWLFGWSAQQYSEIDIFEFVGRRTDTNPWQRSSNRYSNNSHFDGNSENPGVNTNIQFNGGYHKFGLAWYPDRHEYYVDGSIFRVSTFHSADINPLNIIVDMNVFTHGESIDVNTILPYEYKVDYVKLYQFQNDINYCSLDNYIPTLYKNLSIGGNTCTPTLNSGRDISFRATESITFNKGFTAKLGSTFTADIISKPTYNL